MSIPEATKHNKQVPEWVDRLNEEGAKAYCIIGMREDGSTTICAVDSASPDLLAIEFAKASVKMKIEYEKKRNL